jgi:fermentation-respiration switch protein FrsA (DUF1100 family)
VILQAVKFAATAGAVWIALVAILFAAQRFLLYRPDTSQPDRQALAAAGLEEIVATTDDGLSLRFWAKLPAREAMPLVALFHGNAGHHGHRLYAAAPLLAAGYGVALVAYRGYGGNPGRPTETGLYSDGAATLRALAERGVPASRVVAWGESLGTGVATMMATLFPLRGVVLHAPFTSVADRAQEIYWFLPVRWLVRDRFDSRARIAQLRAPLLIVHGAEDRVVPIAHGRELLAAAAEPKRGLFLAGASHDDLIHKQAVAAMLEFLGELRR